MSTRPWSLSLAALLFLTLPFFAASSRADDAPYSAGQNVGDMKFIPIPGMPTCSVGSVRSGDPAKGASIILARGEAGCSFPWHWHTPNEYMMMISGEGRLEMKDGKSITLQAGGFALMPSRHVHQFACSTACLLYVYSDTAFDIHYVNSEAREVSPAEALKKVGETAATLPN